MRRLRRWDVVDDAENKTKFFYIKIFDDYFSQRFVKAILKQSGSYSILVIYQKLELMSLKTNGLITFTGLADSFEQEIAIAIDENEDVICPALQTLERLKLIVRVEDGLHIPKATEYVLSETAAARIKRDQRSKGKTKRTKSGQ